MTFIDQTISPSPPPDQRHLGLTSTGVQWPSTPTSCPWPRSSPSGPTGDTVATGPWLRSGRRLRFASAMCGLTRREDGRTWIVAFRILRVPAGHHVPGRLGIVVQTFALREREGPAIFFAIAGGLTASAPSRRLSDEWTWRPSSGSTFPWPSSLWCSSYLEAVDGTSAGRGVSSSPPRRLERVRFQQSLIWGWTNPAIGSVSPPGWSSSSSSAGRDPHDVALMQIQIFRIRLS